MKKIYPILTLLALYILTACSEESISDLTGRYDIDRYNFTKVENQTTEKLPKGIKALHITLADETGNRLSLTIGSLEWTLQQGTYTLAREATADKQYTATLQSSTSAPTIESGDLEVTRIDNTYFITGLWETNGGKTIKCDYKGTITFEEGEDDPEPSGYTLQLFTSEVITYDETGTPTLHEGVKKYTFAISDPNGNEAALLDAVNSENIAATALAGTYTIQGNAAEPWLMDNGWVYPDWGMAGGSYYVDDKGVKQYITGGAISISVVAGIDGEPLYSFSGSGLGIMTASGDTATGSVTIRFCTLQQ